MILIKAWGQRAWTLQVFLSRHWETQLDKSSYKDTRSLHPVPAMFLLRPVSSFLLRRSGAGSWKVGQAEWMLRISDESPWLNIFSGIWQMRYGDHHQYSLCGMKMKGQVGVPSTTIIELSNKLHTPLLVLFHLFHEIFISKGRRLFAVFISSADWDSAEDSADRAADLQACFY